MKRMAFLLAAVVAFASIGMASAENTLKGYTRLNLVATAELDSEGNRTIVIENTYAEAGKTFEYAWYIYSNGDLSAEPVEKHMYSDDPVLKLDANVYPMFAVKAYIRDVVSGEKARVEAYFDWERISSLAEKHAINLILTVDVEDANGSAPYRIEGDIGLEENCAMPYIMDTFEAYDMPAVFFVNVYEEPLYNGTPYEGYMASLCKEIHDRGFEVALHTHNCSKNSVFCSGNLRDYGYEDQLRILEWGTSFIEAATGQKPIAFRGGAYGVNFDTFQALEKLGYKYDSSSYYGHEGNRFGKHKTVSLVSRAPGNTEKLIEFPVVIVFNRNGKISKLDLDRLSYEEIVDVLEMMQRTPGFKTAQLMLHSYSFERLSPEAEDELPIVENGKKPIYGEDAADKEKLKRLLAYLRDHPYINVVDFREYDALNEELAPVECDTAFGVGTLKSALALEAFRQEMNNGLDAASTCYSGTFFDEAERNDR